MFSIYTLSDLGVLSNLIGSLSLANKQLFNEVEVNIHHFHRHWGE